jgi:hypothetical protein
MVKIFNLFLFLGCGLLLRLALLCARSSPRASSLPLPGASSPLPLLALLQGVLACAPSV